MRGPHPVRQANAAANSVSFVAVTSPNNVSFDDSQLLRQALCISL